MNILSLDTEGPKFDKKEVWRGNAYGDSRPLVCHSWATDKISSAKKWDDKHCQKLLDWADLVVGFNFKHDLTWLRKCGVDVSKIKKLWDVQIAEFVLGRQQNKYPSLDETCEKYGIEKKHDVVKTEYWEKGIDTCDIPWPILEEYAAHDAAITLQCYHKQLPLLTQAQRVLVSLMCQDLIVLQEMEWNGLNYNEKLCEDKAIELDNEISQIEEKLAATYPNVPINFGSNDQLSAFLYGGTIVETKKEHVGFYKTGIKAGQLKFKNVDVVHTLPQLYKPLPGTEMEKEGVYSTAIPTLKKLKGKKGVLDKLLRYSELQKLNSTYYRGIPELNEAMHWPKGKLHSQLQQCSTGTGRLSSSKPNQQNFASALQDIFVSEYD